MASPAGRQQAPHVQQGADEHDAHGHRLPEQVGERHRGTRYRVDESREQETRVQEHAVVRLEVVAVADQPVLRGLADPGEVLKLVRGEYAVGAGDRPALGHQRGQHGERHSGQRHQREKLDAIEPEPRRQRVESARAPALGGGGGGHGGHGNRSAAAQGAAEAAPDLRAGRADAALLDGVRERVQVLLAECPTQHAPVRRPRRNVVHSRAPFDQWPGGLLPSQARRQGAYPLARGRVRGRVVEQLAAGRGEARPRRPVPWSGRAPRAPRGRPWCLRGWRPPAGPPRGSRAPGCGTRSAPPGDPDARSRRGRRRAARRRALRRAPSRG